jgi:hypothetical protein
VLWAHPVNGTALIYSSHNRGRYLHERFLARRALGGWANKRIVFLPMSEGSPGSNVHEAQDFAWGNFRWFFDQYRHLGLEYFPFHWSPHLSKHDVDQLWHQLAHAEVVILGGGHSHTGLERYKSLGARFDGEWGKFGRLLHERAARGLFTVGFSAGADQLGERLYRSVHDAEGHNDAFGLVRNVMVKLHHDASENGDLAWAARRFPRERVFGLPNDSGLHVAQGVLPSGNLWQVIEFVIDNSWDLPSDGFHVKTRAGAKIEHLYPDGRHWAFGGGEHLVRIRSADFRFDESWIVTRGEVRHYWTRARDGYAGIEHLLAAH